MSELTKLWDAFKVEFEKLKAKLDPSLHADAENLKTHAEALKTEAENTVKAEAKPVAEEVLKAAETAAEQAVAKK